MSPDDHSSDSRRPETSPDAARSAGNRSADASAGGPGRSEPSQTGGGILKRIRDLLVPRARLLGFVIPLHLLAFALLYFLSARLMVTEVLNAVSGLAHQQLDHEGREIYQIALGHPGDSSDGHMFEEIVSLHDDIDYRMILPGGRVLGGRGLPRPEHREMVDFLTSGEDERIWLSEENGERRMRGLKRLTATEECASCHQPGTLLAVSSMSMDMTGLLGEVLGRGRRNMLFLIGFWAMLLMATTVVVRRSVRTSTEKIKAQLDAAERGMIETGEHEPDLVLDSTTARLQLALRDYLRRQRERQEEVASRLAHTDQLASLGQLAAGLAHEIKNPLAGIQGALEILREDEQSDSTSLLYGEMLSELDRVNSILKSLLSSARPTPPQITANDACRLVEEVRRLLAPGLRRKNIAVEIECAEDKLVAPFDAAKIRQVLINLVQNAADAIGENGTIKASVMRCPDGTGAIFMVEDDGPGIPDKDLQTIFQPFFTTKFSGTGLGLAIARSLVEQHGGSLDCESKLGTGTIFYVILPDESGATGSNDPRSEAGPQRQPTREPASQEGGN